MPAETPTPEPAAPAPAAPADDLTKVEGIGPKIAELLNAKGITTFAQLGATSPDDLRAILQAEGGLMASRDPSTWSKQGEMAANGQWDELKVWQDRLDGGIEVAAPSSEPQDLTKVEGIGPKVQELLNAKGIMSYAQLGAASEANLKAILEAEGGLMASRNPTTWAAPVSYTHLTLPTICSV